MSFFPVDRNILVNIDKINTVEQKDFNGERVIIVNTGGKEYIVKENIDQLLILVRNIGTSETTRAW